MSQDTETLTTTTDSTNAMVDPAAEADFHPKDSPATDHPHSSSNDHDPDPTATNADKSEEQMEPNTDVPQAPIHNQDRSSSKSRSTSQDGGQGSSRRRASPSDCVQVAVRIRPLLTLERQEPCLTILDDPLASLPVEMVQDNNNDAGSSSSSQSAEREQATSIRVGGRRGLTFTFDSVYGPSTTQADLFDISVRPLLEACLQGYNATIFAYGQTGSGKTHTILGNTMVPEGQGVLPRTIHALFDTLNKNHEANKENPPPQSAELVGKEGTSRTREHDISRPCDEWKVQVQFLELYGEDIRDLLRPGTSSNSSGANSSSSSANKVSLRDGGHNEEPDVLNVTHPQVYSAQQALQILQTGRLRRVTAATAMNATSSRSHALFTILVEQEWKTMATGTRGPQKTIRRSKFHFVDLAGSERQKRTQAVGQRLKEGIEINKGLLVLGNVIAALATQKNGTFVPYRDSKLTRLLRGSLGGNHKTLMIACVSPSADNLEESLNCLRYANRAKQIQNKATINLDPTSQYIVGLQQHIQRLAQQLTSEKAHYSHEQLHALACGETIEAVLSGVGLESYDGDGAQSHNRVHDNIPAQQNRTQQERFPSTGSDSFPTDNAPGVAQKLQEYEREIGQLKRELEVERSHREEGLEQEEEAWMVEVRKSLEEDRQRLEQIEQAAASPSNPEEGEDDSMNERMDAEAQAEEEAVKGWTLKYSAEAYTGDDDDDENDQHEVENDTSPSDAEVGRQRSLQEDLMDLSRSIAAKEELMNQLRVSQARYERMRQFYEEKLKSMEQSLQEKEVEHAQLAKQLETAKQKHGNASGVDDLKGRLREKESHILMLKKKAAELRKLTAVSARNENEIARLHNDVVEMKRKKVDLQRILTSERKTHASELKRMQKEAMQKDRELMKYKRLSSQKEMEATRANQIARTRLTELGNLRSKYRDTEKKMRMQSLKRGVMAKTGLDPVLVGQRDKTQHVIDTNALRDLFDGKVEMVARKEAMVNKLAEEWEEHFQLACKKQETLESDNLDDLENLDLQLQYKEARIRSLAKRLAKEGGESEKSSPSPQTEPFLFDRPFQELCKSAPATEAYKSLGKVLFGMVVRERRRVAALARTACSLDERLQSTEKEIQAKDEALRSYVDEQRIQVAEMSHNQQEQILSLMELVKEDVSVQKTIPDFEQSGLPVPGSGSFDETLLVLANERVSVLENQVRNLETEAKMARTYREGFEEAKIQNDALGEERQRLSLELRSMTAELQKIMIMLEDYVTRAADDEGLSKLLKRVKAATTKGAQSFNSAQQLFEQNGVQRQRPSSLPQTASKIPHTELLPASDSEDEDGSVDEPEWADEILADLALIAEGKIPPSLQESPSFKDKLTEIDRAHSKLPISEHEHPMSVFDRLTDPVNFTGTQKQRSAVLQKQRPPPLSIPNAISESPEVEHAARTKEKKPGDKRSFMERLIAPSRGKKPVKRVVKPENGAAKTNTDVGSENNNQQRSKSAPRAVAAAQYTERDVFERLQRTTTLSYSFRHGWVPQKEKNFAQQQDSGPPLTSTTVDAVLANNLGEQPREANVFERLQKNTTEAYDMKKKSKEEH